MLSFFKKHSLLVALLIYHLIFFVILLNNFSFDKWFIGWDGLNPEFDFGLNVRRAIFAAWQENYGVGLIGGHGFATPLPHAIVTYFLSLILPLNAVRTGFTFLCLYLGGLGMILLVRKVVGETVREIGEVREIKDFAAVFAGLFYILNLGTIQIFYVQLETFIAHFAFLPWLFWIILRLLKKLSRKNLILFFIINFFATLQGFIPSLFVSYMIGLIIFLAVYVIGGIKKPDIKVQNLMFGACLKRSLLILLLTLVVNSYWLLPFSYYQVTRSEIFLNSYNNLISTPHFIDVNKKYGDLGDVAILKGYLFDAYELGDYVLRPWINHFGNFSVVAFGYVLFLLSLFGLIFSFIFIKSKIVKALCVVYLFFFASLATSVFPFSIFINLLQSFSPTYEQAFRTAFTKFSVGVSFSYSIFIGIGLAVILNMIARYFHQYYSGFSSTDQLNSKHQILNPKQITNTKFPNHKLMTSGTVLYILLLLSLFCYGLPQITGNFLYSKLMLKMPGAYFDVFGYFKNQENARVADFPQDCSEGWYTYKWGYFGSGFYWYGLKQPMMARSFDVWSNYNENYYWEITQVLKEQNFSKFDAIMQKYNIKWVLFDPNFIYCRSQKSFLMSSDLLDHLEKSPNYSLIKTFDRWITTPISLYLNNQYNLKNFVGLKDNLPKIGPEYEWNDNDTAYYNYHDYTFAKDAVSYFPFRALFTKRKLEKDDFTVNVKNESIEFKTKLPSNPGNYQLTLNNYSALEKAIPFDLYIQNKAKNTYEASIYLKFPQIFVNDQKITNFDTTINIGEFKTEDVGNIKILVDGNEPENINNQYLSSNQSLINTYPSIFSFSLPNKIQIIDRTKDTLLLEWKGQTDPSYKNIISHDLVIDLPYKDTGEIKIIMPKFKDNKTYGIENSDFSNVSPKACAFGIYSNKNKSEAGTQDGLNYLRLISQDSSQCAVQGMPNLLTSSAYLIEVKSRKISGNNLKISLLNKNRIVYNEEFIYGSDNFNTNYYLIPPTFPTEIGYDVQLENTSESQEKTINDIAGFGIWEIPYNFLKNLEIKKEGGEITLASNSQADLKVEHPNETTYQVNINGSINKDTYLVLSQGFDKGWKAYKINFQFSIFNFQLNQVFPFIFGEELKEHVLVNNWENGWVLQDQKSDIKDQKLNDQRIVIIFWPQYLEFIGFGILTVGLLACLKIKH